MTILDKVEGRGDPAPIADSSPRISVEGMVCRGPGMEAATLIVGWLLADEAMVYPILGAVGPVLCLTICLALLASRTPGGRWPDRLRFAIGASMLALLGVATVAALLKRWEERGANLAVVAPLVSAILKLFGYRAAAERGMLLLDHPDGLITLAPTAEKVAIIPLLLFGTAWFALRLARGDAWKLGVSLLGLGLAALVFLGRFVAVLLVYLEHDQILLGDGRRAALDFVGSRWTVYPSLLLAGWAVDRFVRGESPTPPSRRPGSGNRKHALAGVAVALLGILAGTCWAFEPPGPEKPGRILIDDRFCGIWEPTARRLDTEWYGDFATYSFTSLAEWLGKWYSVDANIGKPYDDDLLSRYDVLVIKTPEEAIPDEEAEAIDRFVRRGGGLLLVGDHTNLLGMGTHLNALSAKYGIRFRYDSVSDGPTGGFVNCHGPLVGRHVGALHVEHFEFMTSCSLQLSGSAETVLAANDCRRDPHDYAGSSFFGRQGPHPELGHGRTVLAATVQVGQGRIAAFTDSTVWSSFAVFEKDREKLAMDMIRLLNRGISRYEVPLRYLAGIALAVAALTGLFLLRSGLIGTAIFLGLLGGWAGIAASEGLHRWIYAWPQPNSPIDGVTFLWRGGACAFPPVLGTPPSLPADRSFDTLLVSTQRLGLVPRVAYTYEDLLRPETRAVCAIAPVDVPPAEAIDRLKEFVQGGGNFVVIDDGRYNGRGSAKEFLAAFDVPITYHGATENDANSRPHVHLGGGMETLKIPSEKSFAARKRSGQGQVVYLSDAAHFSREGLGHCFARPWEEAKGRYETIYFVLRDVLGIAPQERRSYGIVQ